MGVPRHRRTKQPTTDEASLRKILLRYPQDPVIPLVLEARALLKAKGYLDDTYVGRDGRFHPSYTFHPDTGRLSSRSPNIMNQPQGRAGDAKAELAEAIRSAIVPSPGFLLVEADWKAIEAVLVGYFAQDPTYIRAARLGVHAILASHILGTPIQLDLPDQEIARRVSLLKRAEPRVYAGSKKTIHARSYGEGVRAVARDLGCTVQEAQQYIDAYEEMAPLIRRWQDSTRARAHKEHRLVNPFGFTSPYFFEVYRYDKNRGQWVLGSQANEVLAFLPQSTCAAMLRRTLLQLDRLQSEHLHILAPIHDSVLFEVREGAIQESVGNIVQCMEAPWAELEGLQVEVEVKVGPSWSEMSPVAPTVLRGR